MKTTHNSGSKLMVDLEVLTEEAARMLIDLGGRKKKRFLALQRNWVIGEM